MTRRRPILARNISRYVLTDRNSTARLRLDHLGINSDVYALIQNRTDHEASRVVIPQIKHELDGDVDLPGSTREQMFAPGFAAEHQLGASLWGPS